MFIKSWLLWIVVGIGLLAGGYPRSVDASHVGPFVADTAEPIETHKLVFQVIPSFFIKQGVYNEEGNRQYLPSGDRQNQLITLFKPIYGLFNHFEISAEIPVQYNWLTQGNRSANDGGVGEVLLAGKYRFWENDKNGWRPSISGIAKVKFPSGRYEKLSENRLGGDKTGNGSYEYWIGVNCSKFLGDWAVHLNLWYDWVAETTVDGVRTKPGNILNYNAAVEYSFNKKFSFLLELIGLEQGKREEMNQTVEKSEVRSLALMPALGWEINEKICLLMGCSFSLLGKNTDFGFTPALLFNYSF